MNIVDINLGVIGTSGTKEFVTVHVGEDGHLLVREQWSFSDRDPFWGKETNLSQSR